MFEQAKTLIMTLDQRIAKFMEKEQLLPAKSKVLVAVSGGVDSMVLLDVLKILHFDVGCAHINYKLRGAESRFDQQLVEAYTRQNDLPLYIHQVTEAESHQLLKGNLQEIARHIRYKFLKRICEAFKYQFIATGHHKNDQVETLFLNLLRGSGSKGLRSIPAKRDNIVRPLLATSQEDIFEYATQKNIPYRDDSSNAEDHYNRNYIRHQILPKLEARWSDVTDRIATSATLIADEFELLNYFIQVQKSKWIAEGTTYTKFGPITIISKLPGGKSFLYHLLKDYHVSPDQVTAIADTETHSGADFSNEQFDIILDRDHLLIRKPYNIPRIQGSLDSIPGSHNTPLGEIKLENAETYYFDQKTYHQFLNAETIHLPLTIRNWKQGDKWQPLGMTGHKLISDTLIDHKINNFEKDTIVILEDSNGHIIWVSSIGISNDVRITKESRQFIKLTWFARV